MYSVLCFITITVDTAVSSLKSVFRIRDRCFFDPWAVDPRSGMGENQDLDPG
jgi:hypothetical protein